MGRVVGEGGGPAGVQPYIHIKNIICHIYVSSGLILWLADQYFLATRRHGHNKGSRV